MDKTQLLKYGIYGTAAAPFALAQFGKEKWVIPAALAAGALYIYYQGSSGGNAQFQFPRQFTNSAGLVQLGIYAAGVALAIHKPKYALLVGGAVVAAEFYWAFANLHE